MVAASLVVGTLTGVDTGEVSDALKNAGVWLLIRTILVFLIVTVSLAAAGAKAPALAQSESVDYNVARTMEETRKGTAIFLIISVAHEDFSRDRMTQLARQLNRDFADYQQVDVSIFDDETIARNVVPAGSHYINFKKAERGVYHLNRARPDEYLHFSTKRGRPSNEIKLNLRAARPKSRSRRTR